MVRSVVRIAKMVATLISAGALCSCATMESHEAPASERLVTDVRVQGSPEQLVAFGRTVEKRIEEGQVTCAVVKEDKETSVEKEVSSCRNLSAAGIPEYAELKLHFSGPSTLILAHALNEVGFVFAVGPTPNDPGRTTITFMSSCPPPVGCSYNWGWCPTTPYICRHSNCTQC
jgi:hypothetical protein